ncbi:DNA-directed RNA polymerase subunit A' [Vulcanisaeta moutnovskia 768-28]|uniref:DNA-directed RNA polymerase subunit Rpo1N n=1 Tax=Vulcanisaeta moutnovskia (strain 768-28) TaxID=985053 RepID=F0QWN9_VULM7|nr:DNA-directed RNA polymerase subunit A' [Vulcanisaeta moutnovskia]ADY02256.1 DNA-directed RNA polymerase subunit A' [Vulcanisaeta moutnovskia 768-28]
MATQTEKVSVREEEIPLKTIKAIKFSILSPDIIRSLSVMEITTSETYDEAGRPMVGGLMDRRLGVVEPGARCETCGNPPDKCPGHFGRIELARPVIHVEYAKYVHDLLRTTCRECGRILLTDEEIEKYSKRLERLRARWKLLSDRLIERIRKKAMERTVCPHCGAKQYKVRFERPYTFYEEKENGVLEKLDPMKIRERLEKIPDSDLVLLGWDPKFARPEWAILTVLPVPPPQVRPSIQLETGQRSEDDLTHKLVDIVRVNEKLRTAIESGAPSSVVDQLWDLLQYHVATYFNNELPNLPPVKHRSGRPLKTLAQRLKGKEGRFRGSLSGKRVDFSSRTVISPDPNLSINEVGVPIDIAKTLTVPMMVTEWNLELVRQLVLNGPEVWPGANYVIYPDGRRVDLRYFRDRRELANKLAPGFVVERHLMNGDIVLFNRQPSLHRMSMMGHIVRVLPGRTFRLHLAVCPPYNADFDGDEMNLHVPQNEEARAEARTLMIVQNHIITPRYGGPIIGARQDYITGGYLLTRKDNLINKELLTYLLAAANYDGEIDEPAIMHPKELWTGKQVISMLLPKDLNWVQPTAIKESCKEPYNCYTDEYIIIVNGYMATGVLDKKSIGAEQVDSLWHVVVKRYGNDYARRWVDSILRALLRFLDLRGFSMGIDSLEMPRESYMELEKLYEESERKVLDYIQKYKEGRLEAEPGLTIDETLENDITIELSRVREAAARVAERYINKDGEAYIMAKTGARGSIVNITQMVAMLGQQTIRGERFKRGFAGRTTAHFEPGDLGPIAKGFVRNNFKTGLTPLEFFFHAAGGRDGLVDTAVRTAQSGYMQRRLINALQDIYVTYDGTVRNASGSIIQTKYAEDSIDVSKSDHGRLNLDEIFRRAGLSR